MTVITYDAILDLQTALRTCWGEAGCTGAKPTVDIVWDKKVVGFDSDTTERVLIDPQTEAVKVFALHGDAYWHDLLIKIDVRTYQSGGTPRQNIVVKEVTRIIQNIIRRNAQGFLQVVIGNNVTKNGDFRNMFRHVIDLRYQDVNNHTFV
jgi:hypothetical protein